MTTIRLLVAGDPNQYTGGYIYDARMARALTRAHRPVEIVGLAGRFPATDASAARTFNHALVECPDRSTVIVDGLVLGGLPQVVAEHARRLVLVALVHHPLADEFGLDATLAEQLYVTERCALALVARIVVTSPFTARRLVEAYGVDPARLDVVEPGVDKPESPALRGSPAAPPRLLCVAAMIPRKGHAVLIDALGQIADLAWQCDLIGDTRRDPACTEAVCRATRRHGLANRIRLLGTQAPDNLVAAYRAARLFVLPSWYEGYGMVIAEALTYGLPVVTTRGGALADTLPAGAGLAVAPGDANALADALRRLLTDSALHARLAAGARLAADTLPGWDEAGERLAAVLDAPHRHGAPF